MLRALESCKRIWWEFQAAPARAGFWAWRVRAGRCTRGSLGKGMVRPTLWGGDFPKLFGISFFDEGLVSPVDDIGGVAGSVRGFALVLVKTRNDC